MRVVKAHVQPQHVREQVGTQHVCRRPADLRAQIQDCRCCRLAEQQHAKKDQRDLCQRVVGCTAARGVDKAPQQLRVSKLKANAGKQQHRQQQRSGALRPKVGA